MSLIDVTLILIFVSIIAGYSLGSVNFAYIFAKYQHIKINELGSKNPGATNAIRIMGKKIGIFVFILDVLKILIPTLILFFCFHFTKMYTIANNSNNSFYVGFIIYLLPFCGIIGHIFPIWFKFKGGKGVSCYFAFMLCFSWWIAIIWLIIIICFYKIKKIVSIGSIICAIITPFLILIPGLNHAYLMMNNIANFSNFNMIITKYTINISFVCFLSIISSILIIYKHKQNLYNLINKIEKKVN